MKRKSTSPKKINLKIVLKLLLITTIISSVLSLSKFRSTGNVESNKATVAIPVLEAAIISLDDIYPGIKQMYTIEITNTKETITNQVLLDYEIEVKNMGGLPLTIEMYQTENGIGVGENILGKGQTFKMPMEEQTHKYQLEISWDEKNNNYEYSGETSYIKIYTEAVQVNSAEQKKE